MIGHLSDEQMSVALFGIPKDAEPKWERVELPAGERPLPEWARGLHVDLALPYCNAPRFKLKADRNLRDWPDKRFAHEGERFLAVAPDGRAECFYQGGGLRLDVVKRFRTLDGQLHVYRPDNPNASRVIRTQADMDNLHLPGEWVEIERLCTRQEHGFGGAHIDLVLDDGRDVTLRGPWHGACPPGFVELAYVDMSQRWYSGRYYQDNPWHIRGGTGGLFLREDVFIDVFARYAPHMHLARVDLGRGPRLEAFPDEWAEPKQWWMARQRAAKATA